MPTFQYKAIDQRGRLSKGVIESDHIRQVRAQLCEKGLTALGIESYESYRGTQDTMLRIKRPGFGLSDVGLILRQMATLLAVGMPLDEVLSSVAESYQSSRRQRTIRAVLLQIRAKVMEGYSLSSAMSEFPHIFGRLYCMTIAAGEKSAKLDGLLLQLADYIEKQQKIKQKIFQALLYPAIMMCVSIAVVFFMLIHIIPKIIEVFYETHPILPWATRLLLGMSRGVQEHLGYIAFAGITIGCSFFVAMKKQKIRRVVDYFVLHLPLIGKVIREINTARFAKMLGILTVAGVPILEAMYSAAELIMPFPMRTAVLLAVGQVRKGVPIYHALQDTRYFPAFFIYLLKSGEATAQLDAMLYKAATTQENQVENLINKVLILLEPLMILLMGGVVLFIVLAVMLPIFSLQEFPL